MMTHEEVNIWWDGLGSHDCANKLKKILSMNKRMLFFWMVSSNTPIVQVLGVSVGWVLVCNFM